MEIEYLAEKESKAAHFKENGLPCVGLTGSARLDPQKSTIIWLTPATNI